MATIESGQVFKSINTFNTPNKDTWLESLNTNDGQIWFFERKFVKQPNFNHGHYVTFGGSNATYFDLKSNKWDHNGFQPILPVSNEENLEELFFVFKTQLFLLLYVGFGKLQVNSLHVIDKNSKKWAPILELEGGSSMPLLHDDEYHKNSLILVRGESVNGVYILSFVEHIIRVHQLQIDMEKNRAEWKTLIEIPAEQNPRHITPTRAILINESIFIMGGVHGCGFRWQHDIIFSVHIPSGKHKRLEVLSDAGETSHPAFAFDGPLEHGTGPSNGSWLHFGGRVSVGLERSRFKGDVWAIDGLDGHSTGPKWRKLNAEIPDPGHSEININYDEKTNELFVFNDKMGVLKAKIE